MTTILLAPETIECTETVHALRSGELSPTAHIKHLAQRPTRRFRLGWTTLTPQELVWIRYQRELVGGQGGAFDWTPPGFSSAVRARFASNLRVTPQSALAYQAELEIEETRPGS
jgi:hypothetical protein